MSNPSVCIISLDSYGYFVDGHGVTGGGAERQLSLLASELTDEFDVHVIVADYGQPATLRRDGVVLHRTYDPHTDPSLTTPLRRLSDLAATMYGIDADVYLHRGTPAFAAVVATLAEGLGKPWVYNVANDANIADRPAELGHIRRQLFERGVGEAAEIIAQTPKQATLVRQHYDREPAVVPNGYPLADYLVPYQDREYVLWVGRLDRDQKRPHLFVDLAEAAPETEFRMVGPASSDESYHQRLRRRIDSLDNLHYEGTVDPDSIHDYYRNAYCLVSTSAYEGFPNTFLEAWRVGTPVVSLAVDPARIAGDASVEGFADGDFDELVESVSLLATDELIRRRLGTTGRQLFESKFDISAVADAYGTVLRQQT